jgi:hypothetical protein
MFVKGNGEKVHALTTALSLAQVFDLPYHQLRLSDMADHHHEARTHLLLTTTRRFRKQFKAVVGSSQYLISADCITNTFGFDLRQ